MVYVSGANTRLNDRYGLDEYETAVEVGFQSVFLLKVVLLAFTRQGGKNILSGHVKILHSAKQ